MLEAVGDANLSFLTAPPETGVVVVCCGDKGAIAGERVIGAPMIEAGDVVVVCVGGAGDAILGADFDWPSAGPLKAAGPKASRHETTTMITRLNMTHPPFEPEQASIAVEGGRIGL
jgi:hypothetical protein